MVKLSRVFEDTLRRRPVGQKGYSGTTYLFYNGNFIEINRCNVMLHYPVQSVGLLRVAHRYGNKLIHQGKLFHDMQETGKLE